MKIVHTFAFRLTNARRLALQGLGIAGSAGKGMDLPEPASDSPFVTLDVIEQHPSWEQLRALFDSWNVGSVVITKFSGSEIRNAKWLWLRAWEHGYPQPDDWSELLKTTYDLTEWCDVCGVGRKQKAPFQMKHEPRWGRRSMMQLNWIPDEVFVTPGVWNQVFRPAGVQCRSVVNTKNVELKTVVQLVVDAVAGITVDGLPSQQCGKCGRTKYRFSGRGFFPSLRDLPVGSIVRTAESFGTDQVAYRYVLLAQDLAQKMINSGIRGASFCPLAESELIVHPP